MFEKSLRHLMCEKSSRDKMGNNYFKHQNLLKIIWKAQDPSIQRRGVYTSSLGHFNIIWTNSTLPVAKQDLPTILVLEALLLKMEHTVSFKILPRCSRLNLGPFRYRLAKSAKVVFYSRYHFIDQSI